MKKSAPQQKNDSVVRPPVVAIMGHIDHGKSTLLDYIRKTTLVDKEAGGITQHVGAYEVARTSKEGTPYRITFLDTPGHEAFRGIRSRGAEVADVAILVVSAEEGAKPQTLEALKFILQSKTPYIVAINKIDKPGADVERTKANLAEHEVYLEGYGGSVPNAAISAKTGEGVDELLDLILLVAELEELRGTPAKPAEGVVIEAHLDPKRGITATLIIKDGTLKKGDVVVAENALTPVRAIESFSGQRLETASFSSPIRLVGWSTLPKIGAHFKTVATKKEAEALVKQPPAAVFKTQREEGAENKRTHVEIVLKADVAGSLEALEHEVKKLESEKLTFDIVSRGVGSINENDVKSAVASKQPLILGFNVEADSQAKSYAERLGIKMQTFDIIYKLVEWLEAEAKARIPKEAHDEVVGNAKVLKIFSKDKDRQIIGGRVELGALKPGENFKIMRRSFEVGRGRIRGLQHLKEKADEVKKGMEFGAMVESVIEIAPGDMLETFVTTLQ